MTRKTNQDASFLRMTAIAGGILIVVAGCGGGNGSKTYTQFDRLARPAVNEVFATVAGNRHQINDLDNPTDDINNLANDIQGFMGPGSAPNRSQAITDKVKAVLVPDTLTADLSINGTGAGYLGSESAGATGPMFGGRALTDDVIDTSLAVIFGNAIPLITGVADDGHEIPTLLSDNVGPGAKHFSATFPYLGPPT